MQGNRPKDDKSVAQVNLSSTQRPLSHGSVSLLFVIPSEAEGSAVPRAFPGNVFRPQRNAEICGFPQFVRTSRKQVDQWPINGD
jgi:hypothetical protein